MDNLNSHEVKDAARHNSRAFTFTATPSSRALISLSAHDNTHHIPHQPSDAQIAHLFTSVIRTHIINNTLDDLTLVSQTHINSTSFRFAGMGKYTIILTIAMLDFSIFSHRAPSNQEIVQAIQAMTTTLMTTHP